MICKKTVNLICSYWSYVYCFTESTINKLIWYIVYDFYIGIKLNRQSILCCIKCMANMIDSDRRPVSNRRPLTSLSQITVQF
jgi:hypothetical protein